MNSWSTIDDSHLIKSDEPILTVERNGDKWGDVIIHKSAEELEQIIRDNSGTLGGLARLALEILSLRTCEAELLDALDRIADPNKLDASRAPLPDNLARLALAWLAGRSEFENARAVLKLHDRCSTQAPPTQSKPPKTTDR